MPPDEVLPPWILQEAREEAHRWATCKEAHWIQLSADIYTAGRDVSSAALETLLKRAASRDEAIIALTVAMHAMELWRAYEDGAGAIREALDGAATTTEAFLYIAWKLLSTNQTRREQLLKRIARIIDVAGTRTSAKAAEPKCQQ